MRYHCIATLVGTALISFAAIGETLETPATASDNGGPRRGLTMNKVEAQFGAPTHRVEAVGKPPITRWEYPGFIVYFEHEHVLHSVAVPASTETPG
jgi:hypothetical protein